MMGPGVRVSTRKSTGVFFGCRYGAAVRYTILVVYMKECYFYNRKSSSDMVSVPTPIETVGKDTRARTDTHARTHTQTHTHTHTHIHTHTHTFTHTHTCTYTHT